MIRRNLNPHSGRAAALRELMVNDKGFAFDPRGGATFTISHTGLDIIEWLKQGYDDDGLVTLLTEHYDVSVSEATVDLKAFLQALENQHLMKVAK